MKNVGGAITTYVYDAQGQLAAEYGAATDSGTSYLTADHLGSTRLATRPVPSRNAMTITRSVKISRLVPEDDRAASPTASIRATRMCSRTSSPAKNGTPRAASISSGLGTFQRHRAASPRPMSSRVAS